MDAKAFAASAANRAAYSPEFASKFAAKSENQRTKLSPSSNSFIAPSAENAESDLVTA